MNRLPCLSFATCILLAGAAPAMAQYADPPDGPVIVDQSSTMVPQDSPDPSYAWHEPYRPSSSLRVFTGPSLRIGEQDAQAGLYAAMDLGRAAAGFRLSGTWIAAGSENGLSQYSGELWLDLGRSEVLHPVIGAGAGAAVVQTAQRSAGETERTTVGVGVLRASLQYQLPVQDTDARATVDAVGVLPAASSGRTVELGPWALLLATVCVGF